MLETKWIITNGYVSLQTIQASEESGWKFIATVPAKNAHPHACDSDMITFFARYSKNTIPDEDANAWQ